MDIPLSNELWLQPCKTTLSPKNPGQGWNADPRSQEAKQWKKTCPAMMASPIHHSELDHNEKLPPDLQRPVTNTNAQSLEPTPKQSSQDRWITGHQVVLQFKPEGKDRTIRVKPDKRTAQEICNPTIPAKTVGKGLRKDQHLICSCKLNTGRFIVRAQPRAWSKPRRCVLLRYAWKSNFW